MSSEATPIAPARFASALKDLPLSSLHLKAAELRNSIAHLDYSNEQLKPFADGTEGGSPDQDCVDAIKENEIVIGRMQERMSLLRAEVEGRGSSWMEFRSMEEVVEEESTKTIDERPNESTSGGALVNGTLPDVNGSGQREAGQRSEAWSDGTFQTGRIINGELEAANNRVHARPNQRGEGLDDEALRRGIEERMRSLGTADEEEGMHL